MSRWQTPEVATPRVIARTLAVFYALGGIAAFVAASGTPVGGVGRTAIEVFASTALVWAGILGRFSVAWPRWFFHIPVSGASVLIALVVAVSPDPTTAVVIAALICFAAVDAHFFFAPVPAMAHVAFCVAAATAGLLAQGEVHLATAVALDVLVVALALVTAQLVSRASGASRDALTGLRNRRGFDESLDELLARAQRTGDPLSAALLDLDHFKQVNDTAGHQAGDELLCSVADTWRRELPPRAVLARHGGDEFALLVPGVPGPEALDLVRSVAARHPGTRLSVGVAELRPDETAAELMRRADRALYDAKRGGRGRAELDGGTGAQLAGDLATALATGGIAVHYQAVVEVASGECVGVEALARWTHPVRGPVGPDEFIPVAEQHGLIGALGQHVLRTAVTDLTRLRDLTGTQLVLGVNVSGRELTDPTYPGQVRALLSELGWPSEWLILEVTESVLDAESAPAVEGLHALRAAGLHAAIDDFGTGYSSLGRLDTLPVDHLKVDASFTRTLTTSPRRADLLRHLLALADVLGMMFVAEGVETAEQQAALVALGCRYAQGYFFGRPVAVDEFIARVAGPRRADGARSPVPA